MSAIASFVKLPKTALEGLRQVAVPKKRLFGTPRDRYLDYLQQHGQQVADYQWSGFVLATLLPYLEEQHQITLMDSEYDELGNFLTDSRKATHFIFTMFTSRHFSRSWTVSFQSRRCVIIFEGSTRQTSQMQASGCSTVFGHSGRV